MTVQSGVIDLLPFKGKGFMTGRRVTDILRVVLPSK
jgi:hypothetical protein